MCKRADKHRLTIKKSSLFHGSSKYFNGFIPRATIFTRASLVKMICAMMDMENDSTDTPHLGDSFLRPYSSSMKRSHVMALSVSTPIITPMTTIVKVIRLLNQTVFSISTHLSA